MKTMKKYIGLLIIALFPITVNAATATQPKVLTLDATAESSTIKYSGTMEDGSHAVMCKLLDKDLNEINLLSSAVDNKKFEGTFTVTENGKYTVSCANYEGGDTKTVEVTVEEVKTTAETVTPVPTSDNIQTFVMIAIASILAIAGATVYLKKRVKNN